MAQPDHYVQTDCSALDHPKTHALAEALKCHEVAALGAITALRARVMRHRPDGDVTGVTDRTLRVWLVGFPRAEWAAFIASGLVDEVDGKRTMHGWERYCDKEERRAANAERMRSARAARRGPDVPTACNARAAHVHGTCAESARAEEEGEEEGEKEGKGREGRCAGATPAARRNPTAHPFAEVYRGKGASANVRRREEELRTTLGEGLARYADRVADVIVSRATGAENPESYTTSAVRQPWVRDLAASFESADADKRERTAKAERSRPGGPSSVAEVLRLLPPEVAS